jgi:ubiquinone/menaquinone biosynthesis C-methylase UbiE
MHDNISRNIRRWDQEYRWPKDGDEWDGQAKVCGIPYEDWKASLVHHLIEPYATAGLHVIEIAPGHGRWTEFLCEKPARLTAVDLSWNCLDFCRIRFQDRTNIDYEHTDGTALPPALTGQVDLVWSYDAFVHMAPEVIRAYLSEIHRVLKQGGQAILHHANVENIATHEQEKSEGWRSAMDAALMRRMAEEAGLGVAAQFVYWDEARKIGVPRFGDVITRLERMK